MFDEQTKEPEDIFSGNEPDTAPMGVMQPSQPNQAQRPVPPAFSAAEEVTASGPSRTLIIVGLLVALAVLVLIIVLAGMWFSRRGAATPTETTQQNLLIPSPSQPTNESTLPGVSESTTPEPEPAAPVDTDKDGLTDEEEAALRTNVSLADTDADGLSDQEEVRVWNSDPLKADTDGDGFADGVEVKAGYDPNVAGGRLLDVNNPPEQTPTAS